MAGLGENGHEIGGDAIEGHYFSNHYAAEFDSAKVPGFVAEFKYRTKYGAVPDAMAGSSATTPPADSRPTPSVARTGTESPALRAAIAATKDFDGVTGASPSTPRNARKRRGRARDQERPVPASPQPCPANKRGPRRRSSSSRS